MSYIEYMLYGVGIIIYSIDNEIKVLRNCFELTGYRVWNRTQVSKL